MRRRITDALAVLAALVVFSTMHVLPATAAADSVPVAAAVQGQTPAATGAAPATVPAATPTPGGPSSPAGPADPGTGETREAKQTRVDYAPYVVGAVVLAAVIGAVALRQRRKNKTIV